MLESLDAMEHSAPGDFATLGYAIGNYQCLLRSTLTNWYWPNVHRICSFWARQALETEVVAVLVFTHNICD